jgi:hypothetical protein
MSTSYAITESASFTVTHARHMAAKVATDLKRMQRLYGKPADDKIAQYETELIEMLKAGFLEEVTYGFRRDGAWIEPTLCYTSQDLAGMAANDDDPGHVRAGADVSNASFYTYMTYTSAHGRMSQSEREAFEKRLPFTREGAQEPGVSGYLESDRTYSAGGQALNRKSVRSW